MEKTFKKLIIALATAGIVVFVLNLLVDNPYTHRIVRAAINEKAGQYTNLIVDFKALKVNVMPPGVDLYGVYVATTTAPDSPLATASHAKARIALLPLIFGEVKLSLVEGHDVGLVWPPPFGFPGFLKNPAPDDPNAEISWPPVANFPLDRLILTNARIAADVSIGNPVPAPPDWLSFGIVGADIDARFDGLTAIKADVEIRNVDFTWGQSSLLEGVAAKGHIRLDGNQWHATDVELDGARIQGTGKVDGEILTRGKNHAIDGIKVVVGAELKSADLSMLGSFIDLGDTRGRATGKALVEVTAPLFEHSSLGHDVQYTVEGEGSVVDGWLYGFRLFDSAAKFRVSESGVELTEVDVIDAGRQLGIARGHIGFDDHMSYDFKVEPRGIRLSELLDALGITFRTFDAAIESPDLHLTGTGAPFRLEVRATSQFSDITLPDVPFDRSKFPESPVCRFHFHLVTYSHYLDLDGTHGQCFQPPPGSRSEMTPEGKPVPMPNPGDASPTPGSTSPTTLAIDGRINFDTAKGLDLRIKSDSFEAGVAQHFSQVPLSGQGRLDTHVHGPFTGILIDNEVTLDDLKLLHIPLGKLDATVRVKDKDVMLRRITVSPPGGGTIVSRDGLLKIDEQYTLDLPLKGEGMAQSFMGEFFRISAPTVPLAFAIQELDGHVKGPMFQLLAWHGPLFVKLTDMTYKGEKIFDQVSGHFVSDKSGWRSDDIAGRIGTLDLTMKLQHKRAFPFSFEHAAAAKSGILKWGLHPDDELEISYRTLRPTDTESKSDNPLKPTAPRYLDHFADLPFVGANMKKGDVKGQLLVRGNLKGTISHVEGTFDGQLARPQVRGASWPDIEMKGFVKGSKVDIVFSHLGNVLEGRLSTDVMADGMPYDWFFQFNRLDARSFLPTSFYNDPRNFAYLTATWEMQGKLQDWWRSKGKLDLQDIRGKYVQDVAGQTRVIDIKQESPVRMLLDPAGWRFEDDKELFLSGRLVQMRLSLPNCRPPEALSLKLEGTIDLALAREFSTSIDTATGKLKVVAEVIGTVSDPDLVVEVTDLKPTPFNAASWQPVTLGLSDVRPAFRNMQMRIFYAGGRLVIDSLSADKGSGTVNASGVMNVSQTLEEESRLDFTFEDATFAVPAGILKTFETQVSGSATLTGTALPYRLTGDIRLDKARSTQEIDIREEIINALRRQQIVGARDVTKPMLELDVNIEADRSISVHNRTLQSVMSANLVVRGTDTQPSVLGQVEVDKGRFVYKQDFRFERGVFTFDDPIKPDPALDILAVSEVDSYRVYIIVTGRGSNPVVEFTVDPPTREDGTPINRDEILVLLFRGSLPESSRTLEQTQSAAISEGFNVLLSQFEQPVEKLFDLSGQSIVRGVYPDTYPSEDAQNLGRPIPRVNVPLDLGENFDVVLRADQYNETVSAEYDLHENIKSSFSYKKQRGEEDSQQSGAGQSDANLNLKFRFSFE